MNTIEFKKSKKEQRQTIERQLPQLTLNDYVKIEVSDKDGSEIFWVRVLRAFGKSISGVVANDLIKASSFGFDRGSEISFDKECVNQIIKDADLATVTAHFNSNPY